MVGMCLHHGPYGHLALISRCCVCVCVCENVCVCLLFMNQRRKYKKFYCFLISLGCYFDALFYILDPAMFTIFFLKFIIIFMRYSRGVLCNT